MHSRGGHVGTADSCAASDPETGRADLVPPPVNHPLAESCLDITDPELSVPVSILGKDMRPRTFIRHQRMAPYARRPVRFENLCGQFNFKVTVEGLVGAIVPSYSCFGWQKSLYHMEGTVTLAGHSATFKGVRNLDSMTRLAKAMRLPTEQGRMHMAIMSGTTGVAADVYQQGYLEIQMWPCVRDGRVRIDVPFEQNNSLRLSVVRFEEPGSGGDFELEPSLRPASNDWTVTTRGSVVVRMTWDGVEWGAETEAALMACAERVIAFIGRMST